MSYVSFIPDEHLMNCIEKLFEEYKKCHEEMTSQKFFKNRVDPIKFLFDSQFNNIAMEQYLLNEISRQHDQTIGNAIGNFHENLIDGIYGFKKMPVGSGHDIENEGKTILAELKNKHNTVKGEDHPSIHNKLSSLAEQYPNAICYFVRIIDTKSRNNIWEFGRKVKKTDEKMTKFHHERVKIISGDKFYEIITGKKDAFKELCDVLPKATADFLSTREESLKAAENSTFTDEIINRAKNNNKSILEQIYFENFNSYNGYFNATPQIEQLKLLME